PAVVAPPVAPAAPPTAGVPTAVPALPPGLPPLVPAPPPTAAHPSAVPVRPASPVPPPPPTSARQSALSTPPVPWGPPVSATDSPGTPVPADSPSPLLRSSAPVYRAALDVLPPRLTNTAPPLSSEGAMFTVSVPSEVATAFRASLGVDVSTVAIHRGPAVSRMASSLAARAFTQGGEVYLPDELGDVSGHEARALLAHELVHATQQRVLGGGLPTEDSTEGRVLEEAAVATEHWFQGGRAEPPALIHRRAPAAAGTDELAAYVREMRNELALLPAAAKGTSVQRAQPDTQTHVVDELRRILESGEASDSGSPPSPTGPPPMDPGTLDDLLSARRPEISLPQNDFSWRYPVEETRKPEYEVVGLVAPVLAEMAAATQRIDQLEGSLAELSSQVTESEIDPHSPRSMDALADKLYRHVRSRLRNELIIDRERSGRLSDFR
ncbi:eCIS core domain-containing protein, partial [Amycolatopsis sp. H20-H5]|uniref:eCIS core domain-containing protein n=1 Tax=Amycolatopsis sp. H20-H5 TaxID=3046309 RepID=UPI002DBA123B